MKLKSVFFYQAVKVGTQMINSAADDHYDIEFAEGVVFVTCQKQSITVAVPLTNIPQMQLASVRKKELTNIEKARLAKAMKAKESE